MGVTSSYTIKAANKDMNCGKEKGGVNTLKINI